LQNQTPRIGLKALAPGLTATQLNSRVATLLPNSEIKD